MRPSLGSIKSERPPVSTALRLEPVELWLRRQPRPLLAQIREALADQGEPLRWAITGVERDATGDRLRIEAVVITLP